MAIISNRFEVENAMRIVCIAKPKFCSQ